MVGHGGVFQYDYLFPMPGLQCGLLTKVLGRYEDNLSFNRMSNARSMQFSKIRR